MRYCLAVILVIALQTMGGCAHTASVADAKRSEPYIYIYNLTETTRNPDFRIGDELRVAGSDVDKRDKLQLCHTFVAYDEEETRCDYTLRGSDYSPSGTWRINRQLQKGQTGRWFVWIVVNGRESNKISYSVAE